jgi:hypothetical protein
MVQLLPAGGWCEFPAVEIICILSYTGFSKWAVDSHKLSLFFAFQHPDLLFAFSLGNSFRLGSLLFKVQSLRGFRSLCECVGKALAEE